jgi:hypothetical protein
VHRFVRQFFNDNQHKHMKATSYASNVPFWIKLDIDGKGKRWLLAFLRRGDDGREIVFPMEDFEDTWDAERFAKYAQRPILSPDQESKADSDMSQALNEGKRDIPAMSEEEFEKFRADLGETMQDIWNDHCADTGCVPDCIEIHGPSTTRVTGHFEGSGFVSRVADHMQQRGYLSNTELSDSRPL